MEDLLFLAHRIPYPPNKGDKIRSFNLLKHLSQRYQIHLGAFVDDQDDWRYLPSLEAICKGGVKLIDLKPARARIRSLKGLLRGTALTPAYYEDRRMQRWVEQRFRDAHVSRVLVFSSAMAQYVAPYCDRRRRCVIDFVDVDSDKWRQYAGSRPWPMRWLYAREARRLLEYDRAVAERFDAAVFVSPAESSLFARLAPRAAAHVTYVENGVDTDYFNPAREYPNPYLPGEQVLLFTGAMDYWANVDAVAWFAREIFPVIRAGDERRCFYIVGARPSEEVRRLTELPGVRVTGAVADIRPYLAHAELAVAPLRIARGVQNKVLEAMAMGKAVLATRAAVDGLKSFPELAPWVADKAPVLAEHGRRLLAEIELNNIGRAARRYVLDHYNWERNLEHFVSLLQGERIHRETADVAHIGMQA